MTNLRKKGITLLKLVFSGLLLYFIFNRIAFGEVWDVVKDSRPVFLVAALFFFVLSKWIAALRLNHYFAGVELPLSGNSNLKLYILGMFYNLFLPGGIGGDAYKGYLLNKRFGTPVKKLVSVLLIDRLSGMYLLFFYSCLLLLIFNPREIQNIRYWVAILIPASLLVFRLGHNYFFAFAKPLFWKTFSFSAGVQLAQLVSAAFILLALGTQSNQLPYLLLFLISSIAAVLPITLGGIGSRELVFFYGAQWFKLNEGTALAVSILFFSITAFVSLLGMYYHFRKPEVVLDSHPVREGV